MDRTKMLDLFDNMVEFYEAHLRGELAESSYTSKEEIQEFEKLAAKMKAILQGENL